MGHALHRLIALLVVPCAAPASAAAEVIGIPRCEGALACEITAEPPNPVTPDPNDGKLLVWNEAQNVVLTRDLRLDRVAEPGSPFLKQLPDGTYAIRAGTLVSSHYLQWDPSAESASFVSATIKLDAPIFGFIIDDEKLFESDADVGLPGLDYADFWLRGLEDGDWTSMRDDEVEISWWAGSPGDWTRLITAGVLVGAADCDRAGRGTGRGTGRGAGRGAGRDAGTRCPQADFDRRVVRTRSPLAPRRNGPLR